MGLMYISIHVPREGHDNIEVDPDGVFYIFQSTCPARGTTAALHAVIADLNFNPRAPRGARLGAALVRHTAHLTFQSTCPARGTTSVTCGIAHSLPDFNPRAPRGARPSSPQRYLIRFRISIHVPREGHDIMLANGLIGCF